MSALSEMEVRTMSYKRAIWPLAYGLLLITVISCDGTGPELIPPPPPYCHYMPMDVGNKWEYKVTVDSKYNPKEEYKLLYEIKKTESAYKGFPKVYVITVTEEGSPSSEIMGAYDDDKCYIERKMWAYLVEDDMVIGVWTQTGLVADFPLEYIRDVNVKVPAGEWQCRELAKETESETKPEEWREYFAEDVGLVRYENAYKEYKNSVPPELVDWRNEVHELSSYTVKEHPEETN
jgi:hypothetical protein